MTTTDTDVMLREWVTVHRKPQPHGMTRAVAGHRHQVRDLTGQRFGRLVALRYAGPSRYAKGGAEWECRCDCGNLARVPSASLTSWQIMCRTCADCLDRQQHWKDRP
ncbi:hypothetical protein [uncultured Bifidobacterium sp.]|uniref:hypothetical protein n=1 Tax=uncultured Bifidobacterium sp. TaxID=165187 RepID=UPI00258642CF|nr:hypothetical protein [uncultured Bifidobacterium sp.]